MISRLIEFLKYGNKKIYQFSPVRSGSTLVFNILNDLFPNHKIIKCHRIDPSLADKFPIIITYRHPLDSLASTFQALDLEPTDESMATQIKRHKERGLNDLLLLMDSPNVLLLKYESFYSDQNIIFNELESYFDIKIPASLRKALIDKYQVDKIKQKTGGFKDFKEFDKKTHWHGRHISINRGAPGYHLKFFSKDHLSIAKTELKDYIQKLGYAL